MWEADDSQDLWATPGNSPAASMAHGERMVGSELTPEDLDVDRTLRPQRLDDYCGQEHIKQSLRVLIEAAQSRGETLDHVIFSGPSGSGQDHAGYGYRQRAGRSDQDDERSGHRAHRRPGGHPD